MIYITYKNDIDQAQEILTSIIDFWFDSDWLTVFNGVHFIMFLRLF